MIRRLFVLSTIVRLIVFLVIASPAVTLVHAQSDGPAGSEDLFAISTSDLNILIDTAIHDAKALPEEADEYFSGSCEHHRCSGCPQSVGGRAVGNSLPSGR